MAVGFSSGAPSSLKLQSSDLNMYEMKMFPHPPPRSVRPRLPESLLEDRHDGLRRHLQDQLRLGAKSFYGHVQVRRETHPATPGETQIKFTAVKYKLTQQHFLNKPENERSGGLSAFCFQYGRSVYIRVTTDTFHSFSVKLSKLPENTRETKETLIKINLR